MTKLTLILACCSMMFGTSVVRNDVHGAWLQEGIKWQRAPRDINPNLQSGQGAILYFGPNRQFSLIYCTIYRQGSEYTISHGDARGVYTGEWAGADDSISATYRMVEATVLREGQKLPGPIERETITVNRESLTFQGKKFRRKPDLDKSADEAVHGIPPQQ